MRKYPGKSRSPHPMRQRNGAGERRDAEDRAECEGVRFVVSTAASRLRIGIVAVATFARTRETHWTQPTLWRAWLPQDQAVTQHLFLVLRSSAQSNRHK